MNATTSPSGTYHAPNLGIVHARPTDGVAADGPSEEQDAFLGEAQTMQRELHHRIHSRLLVGRVGQAGAASKAGMVPADDGVAQTEGNQGAADLRKTRVPLGADNLWNDKEDGVTIEDRFWLIMR